MEYTTNNQDYLNQSQVGYMVNALLSSEACDGVEKLQATFKAEFGDAIWATPREALHITLMDWLAPLVTYSKDKDELFKEIFPEYDKVLGEILADVSPIHLLFDRLIVSPTAIAIVASDERFNDIRQKFLSRINLLPDTKQPPTITHCTVIRFVDQIPLADIQNFADNYTFSITDVASNFQLVRETTLPMLEYSVVKNYALS